MPVRHARAEVAYEVVPVAPSARAGPHVRSSGGKYYMILKDLLTYPELVHRRIVPEFGRIHVTHWEQVVLVVSLPELEQVEAES